MNLNIFPQRNLTSAFTRTDLFFLVGVLTVLILAHISLSARSSVDSHTAVCRNNLRKLTLAWHLYTEEFNGSLTVSAPTGVPGPPPWNGGEWLDLPSDDRAEYDPALSLHKSPLYPYLQETRVFRCPADFTRAFDTVTGRVVPRVRSYSMNGWMGVEWGASGAGLWRVYRNRSDLIDPGPAKTFVFIDEFEEGINDGAFYVDMGGFPNETRRWTMVDFPADRHSNGAHLSFADGHVELWTWGDSRTRPLHRNTEIPLNVNQPGNSDILRLQSATTRLRNP